MIASNARIQRAIADDRGAGPLLQGVRAWFASDHRTGWTVFAIAVVLRLAWAVHLPNHLSALDEIDFHDTARHIADGDGFVSRSFRANPTLPFYLAVLFKTVGENYVVGRIGQCVIGAGSCLMIWRTAAQLAGRKAGVIAGILVALYPAHAVVSSLFYVDCLLNFFLSLSIYLAVRVVGDRRPISKVAGIALLTGIALGLTALTRPIFMLGIPCVMAGWLYASLSTWRRQLRLCVLLALGSAMTILPWTVRNYRHYHRTILISTGFGTKLWQGNNELADGSAFDRELYWNAWDQAGFINSHNWSDRLALLEPDEQNAINAKYAAVETTVKSRLAALNAAGYVDDRELATDEVLKPIAVSWMMHHPFLATGLFFKKFIPLYSACSDTISDSEKISGVKRVIAGITFYPMLLLAVMGAALTWRDRAKFASLYLLIAAVTGAYCVLNTCTRFRWPLDPYLIIFASIALLFLWQRYHASAGRQAPSGGTVA